MTEEVLAAGQILELGQIEKNPPYGRHVCVMMTETINQIKELLYGKKLYPVPIVARCGEKLYPVGYVETLEAAKQLDMQRIACIIHDVDSLDVASKLHITHSSPKTLNPISIMSIIRSMSKNGANLDDIPSHLVELSKLEFAEGVEDELDRFIQTVGESHTEVPSIMHIMQPLYDIRPGSQLEATRGLINYSNVNGLCSPPDSRLLRTLLLRYPKKKSSVSGTVTVAKSTGKTKPGKAEPPHAGDADIKINTAQPLPEETLPSKTAAIHKCGPHSKTKKFLIDFKNHKIKELKERKSAIVAQDTGVKAIYPLSEKLVEFLDLDLLPAMYAYPIGGRKHGSFALISKKRLTKQQLAKLNDLLN